MVSSRRVVWSWFWLYILAILVVALQPTTPALYLGRYSHTSMTILIVLVVGALPAFFAVRWLAQIIYDIRLPRPVHSLSILMNYLVLLGAWTVNLGPTPSYLIIRIICSYVLVSIIVWSLTHLPPIPRLVYILPVVLIGALLAVFVIGVDYPGLLWTDEGFMVSIGRGFIETGQPIVTFLGPAVRESFSLAYIIAGYVNQLFGGTFSVSRLYILTVGIVAIGIVGITLRLRYSTPVTLLTVIIGIISLININYLRQDVAVAVYLALAFLFYTVAEKTSNRALHILVGFFLGFSLDGHPVAYRFCLGVGFAYILEFINVYRSQKRFDHRLIYLLFGGIAGVASYVLFYSAITDTFGSFVGPSAVTFNGAQSIIIAADHLLHMLEGIPLVLAAAVFGAIMSVRFANAFNRMLLITIAVSVLVVTTFYGPLRSHYVHHMMPLLLLLSGEGFAIVEDRLKPGQRGQVLVGIALACVIAGGAFIAQKIPSSQNYDAVKIIAEEIRELVSVEDVVVGVDPMFFAFYDHPNFYEIAAGQYNSRMEGMSQLEYWRTLAPDYIFWIGGYPLPYPDALLEYVDEEEFTVTTCWESAGIGRVQVLAREEGDHASDSACKVIDGR